MTNLSFIFTLIEENVFLKIALAVLLSVVIGVERELKKKPIGLKTSAIIAAFSCLLTIVSVETAFNIEVSQFDSVRTDPLRLAAQIVSGIGFLGAGAILQKNNDTITGLTTAAMIWGSASIGIAVGANFFIEAIFTVAIVIFIIEVFAPVVSRIGPTRLRQKNALLSITVNEHGDLLDIVNEVKFMKASIEEINFKQFKEDNQLFQTVEMQVSFSSKDHQMQIYNNLKGLSHVTQVDAHFYN